MFLLKFSLIWGRNVSDSQVYQLCFSLLKRKFLLKTQLRNFPEIFIFRLLYIGSLGAVFQVGKSGRYSTWAEAQNSHKITSATFCWLMSVSGPSRIQRVERYTTSWWKKQKIPKECAYRNAKNSWPFFTVYHSLPSGHHLFSFLPHRKYIHSYSRIPEGLIPIWHQAQHPGSHVPTWGSIGDESS